jgi:hypothetical protein
MAGQVTAGQNSIVTPGKTRWIEATIHESIMAALRELPRIEAVALLREKLGIKSVIDACAIIDFSLREGYESYILDDGDYAIVYIEFAPIGDSGSML